VLNTILLALDRVLLALGTMLSTVNVI